MLHSALEWDYWIQIITGDMWAWKTKNCFQDAFFFKQNDDILIANIPYDFVDIPFSSQEDLRKILYYLKLYINDTNNYDKSAFGWFFLDKELPYIRLIIDEAQLYFFARNFKQDVEDLLLIMTQCRKRNIKIYVITQYLAQIDKVFRTLAPYVKRYVKLIFWFRRQELLYLVNPETTNLEDEFSVELQKQTIQLPDKWLLFFNKRLQDFYDQKYLTNFVVGAWDIFKMQYDEFKNKLFTIITDINDKNNDMNSDLSDPVVEIVETLDKKEEDAEILIVKDEFSVWQDKNFEGLKSFLSHNIEHE